MTTSVRKRLREIRKILFRRDRIVFIDLNSPELLQPRGADHVYESVAALIEAHAGLIHGTLEDLKRYMYAAELDEVATDTTADGPSFGNTYFTGSDARAAYAIVRHFRPRRIIEIGSGNSTLFMRQGTRDESLDTHMTCIDPVTTTNIAAAADEIRAVHVSHMDPDFVDDLEANDILFLDGSHVAFNGTDVPYCFLELLPRIKQGVLVHVHDIQLPYEYDAFFSDRHYNEQYLLACMLIFGNSWVPLLPVYYLSRSGALPQKDTGSSFWMRKS